MVNIKQLPKKKLPKKQQIGRCGKLLLQYALLKQGIETSQTTTDSGVDLVAYLSHRKKVITIQVKTNFKPKPVGGKGGLAFDWRVREEPKVDYYAFVDLESQGIWILSHRELADLAQRKPPGSSLYHFVMKKDSNAKPRPDGKKSRLFEFEKYRLENRLQKIFGINIWY